MGSVNGIRWILSFIIGNCIRKLDRLDDVELRAYGNRVVVCRKKMLVHDYLYMRKPFREFYEGNSKHNTTVILDKAGKKLILDGIVTHSICTFEKNGTMKFHRPGKDVRMKKTFSCADADLDELEAALHLIKTIKVVIE